MSNLIDFLNNIYTSINISKRDTELEKKIVLISKVHLRLLATLGTNEIYTWLDRGIRHKSYFEAENFIVITKPYDIYVQPEGDYKNYFCRVFPGAVIVKSSYLEFLICHYLYTPLISLYAKIKGVDEESAVKKLANIFNVSDNIYSGINLPEKSWLKNLSVQPYQLESLYSIDTLPIKIHGDSIYSNSFFRPQENPYRLTWWSNNYNKAAYGTNLY